ncbi:MAG: serine/threonine-protein phosphatase, partial [Actinomycetota bacterium]|nr:serine/threonine-protein phosphatase [Actinomycetota bacterium]
DVVLYLIDFGQEVLQAVPGRGGLAEPVILEEDVATTMAGRVFLTGKPVSAERAGAVRVWVPVVEQADRTGVLALTVPSLTPALMEDATNLGMFAGLLIASAARYTDLLHVRRRARSMSLAANIQWDLLPPLTLQCPSAAVSGLLQPAYEVAGDGFDHALNGDRLDLAVFDGMGHGISSSTLTGLAIGSYRHARREGADVRGMHAVVDETLTEQFGGESFVTGIIARLDLPTGQLSWSNAGHPLPLLLRARRVVGELECEPSMPFGLGGGCGSIATTHLEPGDQVLFFTDGVVEARTAAGEEFGVARLVDLLERQAASGFTPEEVLRRLVHSVLEHQGGALRDDATLVLMSWAGVPVEAAPVPAPREPGVLI